MPDEPQPMEPLELFYSYSYKDEDLRDELETHLSMLKRQKVISQWHDRRILPGQEWGSEIDDHLKTADIILLLVSAHFLASDYCYDIELRLAMERHEAGEARLIPVILRPCDWSGAPFSDLQAFPKAKPVTTWQNRDEAFVDIAKGIRHAAEELRAPRTPPVGRQTHKLAMPEEPRPAKSAKVLCVYTHKDKHFYLTLQEHLSLLRRVETIGQWFDGMITPGEGWAGEMAEQLELADVLLLLVSADFVNSDFCYGREMKRALERHAAGEAVVVPIMVRPCDWKGTPFDKLQFLPADGQAITKWPDADMAFYEVAKGVRNIIEGPIDWRPAGLRKTSAERRAIPTPDLSAPPAVASGAGMRKESSPSKTDGRTRPALGNAQEVSRHEPTRKSDSSPRPRSGVFVSYSRKDGRWLERLQIMLRPAIRKGSIRVWDDTQIRVGSDWKAEIKSALETAKMAVLLVSPNFLASDFITENELQPLLEDAKKDGVTILWVAVSACLYKETEIANYQAANNPDRPLNTLRAAEVNKQLVNICEQIKSALDS